MATEKSPQLFKLMQFCFEKLYENNNEADILIGKYKILLLPFS